MGPAPAVATVRREVRRALAGLPSGTLALVACSGGPDSLALAAAAAFEAPRSGHRAGGVTVDHGLQLGSGERADSVVAALHALGLEPAEALAARVGGAGGPEAAAREARYRALDEAASRHGAAAVLLAHTRDDQAETVLLGLARGSGARSLAGMRSVSGIYRRPLLGVDRVTTRGACAAEGLTPWDDPHNADPAYTRARIRRDALPALERALGGGVAPALARTAELLRDDADALDAWAERAWERVLVGCGPAEEGPANAAPAAEPSAYGALADEPSAYSACAAEPSASPKSSPAAGGSPPGSSAASAWALDVGVLGELPPAVRGRVLRRAAVAAGCPPRLLAAVHIRAAEQLVTSWRGQRWTDLPGGVRVSRRYGKLLFTSR